MSVGRKVFCVPVESNATIAIVTRVGIQRSSTMETGTATDRSTVSNTAVAR